MGINIEIKARTQNLNLLRERLSAMNASLTEIIHQEDTFFPVSRGRLKLRVFPSGSAQLIHYVRSDQNGPKRNSYDFYETDNPESLKATLASALGIRGVVRKERHLYLVGQTRVHLDTVSGLGSFVELEVVLRPDQPDTEGQRIAQDLMVKLDIRNEDLIEVAYMDMLESK